MATTVEETTTDEFLLEGTIGEIVSRPKQEVWVDLIREGFGNKRDRHAYPGTALESAKDLFLNAKMYVNHLDPKTAEKLNGMPRDVQDLGGRIREVKMATNADGRPALRGRVSISQPWLWQLVEHDPELIGVSINARGSSREGMFEGQPAKIVESINKVVSVDWVTEAGAGGKVVSMVEAQLRDEGREDELMGIEQLTEDAERSEELLDDEVVEAKVGDVVHHHGKRKRIKRKHEGRVHFEDGTSAPEAEVKDNMKEGRARAHARRHTAFPDSDHVDPGLVDPNVAEDDRDGQSRHGDHRDIGLHHEDDQDRMGHTDWTPVTQTHMRPSGDARLGRRGRHMEAAADTLDELEELDMDDMDYDDDFDFDEEDAVAEADALLDDELEDEDFGEARKRRGMRHRKHGKAVKMRRHRDGSHSVKWEDGAETHHRGRHRESEIDDFEDDEFDDLEEARHRKGMHHKVHGKAKRIRHRGDHYEVHWADGHKSRHAKHHMREAGIDVEDLYEGEELDLEDDFDDYEGFEGDDFEEGDDEDLTEAHHVEYTHHTTGRRHRRKAHSREHAHREARKLRAEGHRKIKVGRHRARPMHHRRGHKMREGAFDTYLGDESFTEADVFGEADDHGFRVGDRVRVKGKHRTSGHVKATITRAIPGGSDYVHVRADDGREGRFHVQRLTKLSESELDDGVVDGVDLEEQVEARARELARENLEAAVEAALESQAAEYEDELAELREQADVALGKVEQRQRAAQIIETSGLPDPSQRALKAELYDAYFEAESDADGVEVRSAMDVLTEAVSARIDARSEELSVFSEARITGAGPTTPPQRHSAGDAGGTAPTKAPSDERVKKILGV